MSKEIKKKSRKREQEIAKQTGGKRHTGSGALWWKKSDASDSMFQYEDKFTDNNYFTLSLAVLNKIAKEARGEFKIPVLRFGFTRASGIVNYAVMRERDCCYKKINHYISSNNKSIRIKLEYLQQKYRELSESVILFRLSLQEHDYLLLTWDDFLDVKDIIISGGII